VRAHLWIVSETCAISAETDSLMTACGHQRTISMDTNRNQSLRYSRSQTVLIGLRVCLGLSDGSWKKSGQLAWK
jgi:hypothetical protein